MNYVPQDQEMIQHSLFGGVSTNVIKHNVFTLQLDNLDGNYSCNFQVLDQERICGPIAPIASGKWIDELSKLDVRLSDFGSSGPIEILIGADVAGKLFTGNHASLSSGLVAIETKLGWTLIGKMPSTSSKNETLAMTVTSMLTREAKLSDLWSLDVLGITDPVLKICQNEKDLAVQKQFLETVCVTDDNRFQVNLPWTANHPPLPSNRELALKRLKTTVRKLQNEGLYSAYQQVFDEWISDGVIEEVPMHEVNFSSHYLPHKAVLKPGSTTPVRPVFDASAKEGKNPSLNQCLEKGPNLLEKIPSVLAKFRLKRVGVVGDIKRAFLQIALNERDRNFLRFFWIDENEILKMYRHCRVVFGVTSSPFHLEATLKLHIEETLDKCKKGQTDWPTEHLEILATSFYVDNCTTSLDSDEQVSEFIEVASGVLKERKFELRNWEFTELGLDVTTPTKVLGLLWNRSTDTLTLNLESLLSLNIEKVTKKIILSAAHRLYDPIGVTCSVALVPKILLQQTWASGIGWDQEVNEETQSKFMKWMNGIKLLSNLNFPRWVSNCNTPGNHWTVHVFSDASQNAYAAAVFLRFEFEDSVHVQLLAAKARVAPTQKAGKKITIPRLELLGTSIAARLYHSVAKDFHLEHIRVVFWTDSTTVLAWITRDEPWDTFVYNRIKEIRNLTSKFEWRHVPGPDNPADLPSRGSSARKLLALRWWEGPSWLRDDPKTWPISEVSYDESEINAERKSTFVSSLVNVPTDKTWYYRYFSDFKKLVRFIGWIYRFKSNCQVQKTERTLGDLSATEYAAAERKVIFLIQDAAFAGVRDPRLSNLMPFIDCDSIIRLTTKISNRNDEIPFRYPAVLPSTDHPAVLRLVLDIHQENSHAGTQLMMSLLRQQFWILGGRRAIKKALKKCARCQRYSAKNFPSIPPPLPENRVRQARTFEVTGVDLAGPLYLKVDGGPNKNFWVCLFTCGIYRAVHLELVSSQSTDSFLLALRRFINRRGRPRTIYSDQGTNFVGANNDMKTLDWKKILEHTSVRKIEWCFNPPGSPWWGGWWERLIGIMKNLLRRVLGRSAVNQEEMTTLLSDCEAVINSRPLTYISQDAEDLTPLTPNMFLIDIEEVGSPDLDRIEASDLKSRVRYRQRLKMNLQNRFRSEYLGQLKLFVSQQKTKPPTLGAIVLIGSDDTKRIDWPLGRIVELVPGRDGRVRVVKETVFMLTLGVRKIVS
ncbi:Pao retrotransposon peptidase [Nesidiocoris tenuis]|uniref:Pao retrotransposon peptidase n=2 Tax=Nesidiocoris tenuis TaxID=355587 RepID=A0ABN7AHY3_9HEMI|nr:Pao retrotransposon peptidase [Nesidiocoris tenuis]